MIGDFTGVRKAETDSMEAMVTNGISPEDALKQAADNSNKAITDYNERAGVGG